MKREREKERVQPPNSIMSWAERMMKILAKRNVCNKLSLHDNDSVFSHLTLTVAIITITVIDG